jgi:hypothetical protein
VSDTSNERMFALSEAVALYSPDFDGYSDNHALTDTATVIYQWLTAPLQLVITLGPTVDQTTGEPTGNQGGNTMKDSDKAQLIVKGVDAKGQDTTVGTDVTFVSADESIVTITTDGTGQWAVAGIPGSTVITGTWNDSPTGPIEGTVAVDVTAGNAASLVITLGDAVPQ